MHIDILIVLLTGWAAGFIGGQVGGGGLLTLPVLLFLGLPPAIAIGTNRFAALFLNGSATFQYYKKKKIKLKSVLLLAVFCIIGSIIGANITLWIDEIFLKKIIAGLLIMLLVITLYKKNLGLIDKKLKTTRMSFALLSFFSFLLGIYGGFAGIAVTTFLALLFVFYGQSFTQGMGYALHLTFLISIGATAIFILNEAVIYHLAIPQAIGTSVGALMGAKFAIKKGNIWVKYLFIAIASVFIIKILFDIL